MIHLLVGGLSNCTQLFLSMFIYIGCVLAIILILLFAILPSINGAIFLPTHQKCVDAMVALADLRPGDKMVDLGSGDGRIVLAFAKAGAEAHGYEINPILVWRSRRKIRAAGLANKAFIHWKSFWNVDFSKYSVIALFGFNSFMEKLEGKLQTELNAGARVVSYAFQFPTWQSEKKELGVFLYKK